MEAKGWGRDSPVDKLFSQVDRYEFTKALCLLEFLESAKEPPFASAKVKFNSSTALSFMAAPLDSVEWVVDKSQVANIIQVQSSEFGLFGSGGVLPFHYVELLQKRAHEGEYALQAFLDLFNHHLLRLFYKAQKKYRLYYNFNPQHTKTAHDIVPKCLRALMGLESAKKGIESHVDADSLLFYSGFLTQHTRSVAALESLVAAYFSVQAKLQCFQGGWQQLAAADCTRLTVRENEKNYHCLGSSAVIGSRLWSIQNKFRLTLGPMSYADFLQFLPGARFNHQLKDLVNLFARLEWEYDVQLVLRAADIPDCQLITNDGYQLGRNTWLLSKKPSLDSDSVLLSH